MANISKSTIQENKSRNIVIDITKGILILLMVIGHSGAPKWLENCIYSFHMPCFFIVSGFLFSFNYLERPWQFIKKRTKSLWWPFVKWTLIFLLIHNFLYELGIYENYLTNNEIIKSTIRTFFLLHAEQLIGGLWFLQSLFIASIISFIYYKLIGVSMLKLLFGIGFLLFLSEMIKVFHLNFLYFNATNLLATAYFMIGTFFNKIKINDKKIKMYIHVTAIILISLSIPGSKVEISNLTELNLLPYFFKSIIISLSIFWIIESFQEKNCLKYFIYLGNNTLDILIIHFSAFKLISLIKILIYDLDFTDNLSQFPVIQENNTFFWIVYVILSILICLSYSKSKEYLKTSLAFNKLRKFNIT